METPAKEEHPGEGIASRFSPEIELLIRGSLPPSSSEDATRIRTLIENDLSWERILDVGGVHGVVPSVYRHLETMPDHDVPDKIVERLRSRAQSTTIRNLQSTDELHDIFQAFESNSVRAIPFKGPVLAEVAYGGLSLREFFDLDILIHREDVPTAVDVLESRGYEWTSDAPRLDDSPLLGGPFTQPLVCEYELVREDHMVEIRWRVGESNLPFGIEFETLWNRRERTEIAGMELPVLDPEDRLLMLSYHGTKHRWNLLKWIADFAMSMEESKPDWDRLFRRAKINGLERKLLVGIGLSTTLYSVSVPRSVIERVRDDKRTTDLVESVVAKIGPGVPERPGSRENLIFNARASDSASEIARMLLHRGRLHPSIFEYRHLPLPGEFHPLYYLIVPLRLTVERIVSSIR